MKNLDLLKNEKFSEMLQNLHLQQVQITENTEKIKNLLKNNEQTLLMDIITRTKEEINKLFDKNRGKRININKILVALKGGDEQANEESENKNYEDFSGTINSKINFLLNNYTKVYDKVINMKTKVSSMSKTMKEEVKKFKK